MTDHHRPNAPGYAMTLVIHYIPTSLLVMAQLGRMDSLTSLYASETTFLYAATLVIMAESLALFTKHLVHQSKYPRVASVVIVVAGLIGAMAHVYWRGPTQWQELLIVTSFILLAVVVLHEADGLLGPDHEAVLQIVLVWVQTFTWGLIQLVAGWKAVPGWMKVGVVLTMTMVLSTNSGPSSYCTLSLAGLLLGMTLSMKDSGSSYHAAKGLAHRSNETEASQFWSRVAEAIVVAIVIAALGALLKKYGSRVKAAILGYFGRHHEQASDDDESRVPTPQATELDNLLDARHISEIDGSEAAVELPGNTEPGELDADGGIHEIGDVVDEPGTNGGVSGDRSLEGNHDGGVVQEDTGGLDEAETNVNDPVVGHESKEPCAEGGDPEGLEYAVGGDVDLST